MYAILYDETRCVGCNKCVEACAEDNNLPPRIPDPTAEGDGLSGRRWTSIVRLEDADRYVKKQCLHCLHPACEAACLVGAMKKTANGPVIYDASKCIGCRYCMLACPVGIPRYDWDNPLPHIQKCDMCFDRLAAGKICACVAACPHGALSIDEREKQLQKARALINSRPDKYVNHIYGEHELGGTCVLYITDTPLDKALRFDKVSGEIIPDITWPVINKTPIVALGVLGGLVGAYFIFERKKKVAAYEQESRGGESGGEETENQEEKSDD